MKELITMRIHSIGDFRDGSLRIEGKRMKLANAAVIEFKSDADAQRFAREIPFNFQSVEMTTHAIERKPAGT